MALENTPENTPEKPQISFFDKVQNFALNSGEFISTAIDKIKHISRSNVEMGILQMRSGEFFDAATRFRIAIFFDKTNAIAYYLLGKSLVYAGKKTKAIAPLRRALELNSNLTEANFLLSICGGWNNLGEIPRSFIIERADLIADNYDKIYPEGGKTNLVAKLEEEFTKYFENWQGFSVLELNCAVGEIGSVLRKKANVLIGVDPSIKMAAKARARRENDVLVYNKVAGKFPEDYLAETDEKFQVILAIHYLGNFAKLDSFFAQVRTRMAEGGGVFIFTITPIDGADSTFMADKILFQHSEKYIEEALNKAGFKLHKKTEVTYESGMVDLIYIAEVI